MHRIELSAPLHWGNYQINYGSTKKYVVDWRFQMSWEALEQFESLGYDFPGLTPLWRMALS